MDAARAPVPGGGRLKALLVFALIWPPLGFALGTATLLGPVRWITNATREAGFSPASESAVVVMIMVGLLGGSLLIGLLLTHRVLEARSRIGAVRIPAVVVLAATGALWAWFTPSLLNQDATVDILQGTAFTFGPYPEAAMLDELAREGYTHVISLLHPAVIPFEPVLLAQERENVARAGLEFVHAPLLPWVGDNHESLELIRALAEAGEGKFYVHCYLGRDRVGVVSRLVSGLGPTRIVTSGDDHPLAGRHQLERGTLTRVGADLFIVPFPTDEEMLAFFLNHNTTQVVSLLDPTVEANGKYIEHEREQLRLVGVPLVELPLSSEATEEELVRVAEKIARLEGVTIVHRFRSDDPVTTAIMALLRVRIEQLRDPSTHQVPSTFPQ